MVCLKSGWVSEVLHILKMELARKWVKMCCTFVGGTAPEKGPEAS